MKNRLTPVLLTIALTLSSITLFAQNHSSLGGHINKFGQALFYINQYYIDTVNNENLVGNAIKEVLSQLDPHSSYISSSEVKAMNEPLEGNFEGVGIEFSIIRDTLTVVNPVSGGPSERVGIRAGDKIVVVDGEKIASTNLTNERVYKYLRGAKGTRVKLGVLRRGVEDELSFEVVRDKIPINSVDVVYEPAKGILYIKLSRFSATSAEEISSAVRAFGERKWSGVVLDLRGNTGGYLGTAFEITNMFLEKGQTIVYTEGRSIPKMVEYANGNGLFKNEKLAVLIDEGSASASEILAGAVQDWDRGVIIGRRSFGKGLVQQMLPLPDGSQMRLTIARYHTPSGRVIQSPYEEGAADKYYRSLYERYSRGEYFSRDSIHFPDSLKYKTLVKEREVYGGGGIMPDIFIPADTTGYSNYYGTIARKGIILDYMNDLSDKNRDNWKATFNDFDTFVKEFDFDRAILYGLADYAEMRGVPKSPEQFEISKKEIEIFVKALAARSLFGAEGYYRIVNFGGDEVFEVGLKEVIGY
ncbi:MAG: S41 family peptidase [Bacteroidales bacterium]|nr:S41 family peptidase [Bacteroidales bacterium]